MSRLAGYATRCFQFGLVTCACFCTWKQRRARQLYFTLSHERECLVRNIQVSGRPDLATDSVLRLTVSGLEPFTSYHLRVVACTDGGCNTSATIQQRTSEGTPAEFDAPSVLDKNSTAIHLEWAAPRKPYGTILRLVDSIWVMYTQKRVSLGVKT